MKIGYAYAPLTINARTDNKIVSKHFSNTEFIEIFKDNLLNLKEILTHNVKKDIHLFRLSSDILDNITLYNDTTDWTSILSSELASISNIITSNDIRITMFPQKYTLLNSPNEEVVEKSIKFLEAHVKFMKALKLDASHKIILEIGGVYTHKLNAQKRFLEVYKTLDDSIKERLVLVNDCKNYSLSDVLYICKEISAPMILNTLCDNVLPSIDKSLHEKLDMVTQTWQNTKGKMIIHYSQQKHSAKSGEQSDTIFTEKFLEFYNTAQKFDTDITLDVNDGDISTLKCQNIIKELNDKTFDTKFILEEYQRYRLLILEKGFEFEKNALTIANTAHSIIEFYKYVDEVLETFIDKKAFLSALREALRIMSESIKSSEKNHIEKLILNRKLDRCKTYMHEVAVRNNSKEILKTYFFSQK